MVTRALLLILLIASVLSLRAADKPIVGSGITYPIRFAYVDRTPYWYSTNIAIGLGVPGYAPDNDYNYFALAFWTCGSALDMAAIWANALTYFTNAAGFGNTTPDIQKFLRQKYNDAGKKILVSAFGSTSNPTSASDPVECATSLGNFVLNNNLDGADIDYEDNTAMNNGIGEAWLIAFTRQLRSIIPGYIITHAPQAPYFCKECYKNGGYITVHEQVGDLIDFYNIQFYNQVEDAYTTFSTLFEVSGGPWNGTSVKEINARGVPLNKLVIGKPVLTSDASNTGWVSASDLNGLFNTGLSKYGWYAGLMIWQYPSDTTGSFVSTVATDLINYCANNPNICK
jgi:hypothetical protein